MFKLFLREAALSNSSFLVQYGKVQKFNNNGSTLIDIDDLKKYYISLNGTRELNWKRRLRNDLNWRLSFDHLGKKTQRNMCTDCRIKGNLFLSMISQVKLFDYDFLSLEEEIQEINKKINRSNIYYSCKFR